MSLRLLLVIVAVLIGLSAAWGRRHALQEAFAPPPPPPKKIQFDNGTVRQYGASSAVLPQATVSQIPHGTMRKCVKGREIIYTDIACPPGHSEKAVAGLPVNVLAGQVAAAKPNLPQASPDNKSSLYDTLDMSRDEKIRERMIERAVEGQK